MLVQTPDANRILDEFCKFYGMTVSEIIKKRRGRRNHARNAAIYLTRKLRLDTFKEIGEQTLITKGTLTGVVDRLEEKGLVKRKAHSDDRRCMRVVLTALGDKVFTREFPRQIAMLKKHFDRLSLQEMQEAVTVLHKLRKALS